MGKKRNQKGGSLVSGAKTVITPIEYGKTHTPSQIEISDVPVKIISPAQAAVDQAKTEMDHKAHVKRCIKRKLNSKSTRRRSKRRRLNFKTQKRKKVNAIHPRKRSSGKSVVIFLTEYIMAMLKKDFFVEGQPSELSLFRFTTNRSCSRKY